MIRRGGEKKKEKHTKTNKKRNIYRENGPERKREKKDL